MLTPAGRCEVRGTAGHPEEVVIVNLNKPEVHSENTDLCQGQQSTLLLNVNQQPTSNMNWHMNLNDDRIRLQSR